VTTTEPFSSTVDAILALDGQDRLAAWDLYERAYEPLGSRVALAHKDTQEAFLERVGDERVVKFVARKDDKVVALAMLTTELSLVKSYSEAFFRVRFAPGTKIWHFGSFCVSPEHRSGPWAGRLLLAVIGYASEASAVVCYDFAEANAEVVSVAKAVRCLARRHGTIRSTQLCSQAVWAIWDDATTEHYLGQLPD